MANTLDRRIQVGEIVVLNIMSMLPHFRSDPKWQLFKVIGGFGMSHTTGGSALYGSFVDGSKCAGNGYWIDKEATEKFQNGEWKITLEEAELMFEEDVKNEI